MNRRRFLDRTQRQRDRRRRNAGGFDPGAMIRLAGFGAALTVGVAVYIGFARQGETIYDGRWGTMQRLISPLFLGFTALDLIVLVLVGLVAWRIWRRMQKTR